MGGAETLPGRYSAGVQVAEQQHGLGVLVFVHQFLKPPNGAFIALRCFAFPHKVAGVTEPGSGVVQRRGANEIHAGPRRVPFDAIAGVVEMGEVEERLAVAEVAGLVQKGHTRRFVVLAEGAGQVEAAERIHGIGRPERDGVQVVFHHLVQRLAPVVFGFRR